MWSSPCAQINDRNTAYALMGAALSMFAIGTWKTIIL